MPCVAKAENMSSNVQEWRTPVTDPSDAKTISLFTVTQTGDARTPSRPPSAARRQRRLKASTSSSRGVSDWGPEPADPAAGLSLPVHMAHTDKKSPAFRPGIQSWEDFVPWEGTGRA